MFHALPEEGQTKATARSSHIGFLWEEITGSAFSPNPVIRRECYVDALRESGVDDIKRVAQELINES